MRFSMAMVASRIEEMREAMYDTVFPGWARIGGQAAVLSARNYWKALEALDGLPGSIPQWREAVDFGAFKEAKNAFGERFPEVDRARHSIAHPEFYPNPDMAMRPEGWQPPSLEDRYEGWWAYFDGVLVRCEVTEAGARFMAENAAKVFAAFEAIPRRAPAETGRPR
jgi:hypothetical protein